MMSGIRGKNTRPELALRREMHARGFRYRLHAKDLPGLPDLSFPKYYAVVFVHGCFWHRHVDCRFTTIPSTRPEFWNDKFAKNVARDERIRDTLLKAGWRVATVWECALRKPLQLAATADRLGVWLGCDAIEFELGEQRGHDANSVVSNCQAAE